MAGDSHAAMNAMMIQAHGEDGEEQIHIVMGKRLFGGDTSAAFPAISGGWMPMMNMLWGGWLSPFGSNNSTNNMMNFGFGPLGGFGWIFMISSVGFDNRGHCRAYQMAYDAISRQP